MLLNFFFLFIFIERSFETEWGCPQGPEKPELSTTFLQGYWFEVLQANQYLNNATCSHFDISCDEKSSSCKILHVFWDSYVLKTLGNGTITQGKEKVHLSIQGSRAEIKELDVNIKFDQNFALIWSCQDGKEILASLLKRMDTDEDMEAVWFEAEKDMTFPAIIEQFPAEIWKKNNFTACSDALRIVENALLLPIALCMTIAYYHL